MDGENEGGTATAEGQGPSGGPPTPDRPGQVEGGIEDAVTSLSPEDIASPEEAEVPTAPEGPSSKSDLEEALETEESTQEATEGEQPELELEEGGQEEGEEQETPEGEEPEPQVRYRDPETGQFISEEEARAKGLDPEELTTAAEAADDFFGDEEEAEEGEEPDVEPVELELGEDETLEIAAEDEETREHLEQLKADAEEGRQLREQRAEIEQERRQVERDKEELDQIERRLSEDPTGFMLNQIPEDRRAEVARDILLLDDEVRSRVQSQLNEWSRNPSKLEVEKERRKRERTETEYETGQKKPRAQLEREAKEMGQRISNELHSYIPDDASEERKNSFLQRAGREVKAHIQQNPEYQRDPTSFDVDQLPDILGDLLDLYGFEPPSSNGGNPTDVPEAEPADEATAELAEEAERYRSMGERLRKARARKRKAATSAPAGKGSTPTRPGLGSDADLDDALEYAEEAAS